MEYFIAGHWSGQFIAALEYIKANDLLMVSPSSTSAHEQACAPDNAFRLAPPDSVQAMVINEMLSTYRDGDGIQGIVVIFRDDLWANGIVDELYEVYGGEIVEIPYPLEILEPGQPGYLNFAEYLTEAELAADGLVAAHSGADHVGVLLIVFDEADSILQQTNHPDYDQLYDLSWFGAESMGRSADILLYAGEEACHVHLVSALGKEPNSVKFNDLADRLSLHGLGEASFFTATDVDAAWLIVQAVLEARSVFEVFPSGADVGKVFSRVAYRHFGYSGWTLLDENGDRAAIDYDIWGFGPDPDSFPPQPSIINYGYYDSINGELHWTYDPPPWDSPSYSPP